MVDVPPCRQPGKTVSKNMYPNTDLNLYDSVMLRLGWQRGPAWDGNGAEGDAGEVGGIAAASAAVGEEPDADVGDL